MLFSTAACSNSTDSANPLQAACRTASTLIGDLRVADQSGIYQVDDISAAPSVYQTTWRLKAAKIARKQIVRRDDRATVRDALLKIAVGGESSDADPGLEGLELRTTAALGLATLPLEPSQRELIARSIDAYRAGGEYRLTKSDDPTPYATFIATSALHALHAPVPDEVRGSLASTVSSLPVATYNSLDEIIVPRVGSYLAAGGTLPSGVVTGATLRKWNTLIGQQSPDALSLSLTANLHTIADLAQLNPPTPVFSFSNLNSGGGWAAQAADVPDPKITYYATVLGLRSTNLQGYLSSGRGQDGWLPQPAEPTIQSAYLAERAADICPSVPRLNAALMQKRLRAATSDGASVLDLARICYLEKQRKLSVVPHTDLASQFAELATQTMTFEDAVELRVASKECHVTVSKPVTLNDSGQPSRYHYLGAAFLKKTSTWAGTTNSVRTQRLAIPSQYELIVNAVLKASPTVPAKVHQFKCGNYYCGISKNGRGDSRSASPTTATFVVALEGLRRGNRTDAILAGN
ncbi:hypothetical protein [Curtobacterium pusillum]|uniref:hypothetical protein n=1 Tax=Curtobacterium pusillum TaxID=69373 RepID=UPI0011A710DA|nr:hypothetical protein [Curtobacterium pusillum]